MHPLVTLELSRIRLEELRAEAALARRGNGLAGRPVSHHRALHLLRSLVRVPHRAPRAVPCPPCPERA